MDPSNQLFGHYLRYRMDMQKRMAEQHNGQPKVSAIGAAMGKLCRNIMGYQATHKKPELFPGWSKKQLEPQTHHSHCPQGSLAPSSYLV